MNPPASLWIAASRPWMIQELRALGLRRPTASDLGAEDLRLVCTRCGQMSDGAALCALWDWDGRSRPADAGLYRWTRDSCLREGCDGNSLWVKFSSDCPQWRELFEGASTLEDGDALEVSQVAEPGPQRAPETGWRWVGARLVIVVGLVIVAFTLIRSTGWWTRAKSALAPEEVFRASPASDPFAGGGQ